ncbi:MAG: DUF5053 domain-containing protein [Prevotella sp.]|nr:DUF5053 domain-containing protein [Prevotella sp.]
MFVEGVWEVEQSFVVFKMNKFQHKTHGIDGNGGTGGFTEQEAEQLKKALIDLSNRIRRAAENIQARP